MVYGSDHLYYPLVLQDSDTPPIQAQSNHRHNQLWLCLSKMTRRNRPEGLYVRLFYDVPVLSSQTVDTDNNRRPHIACGGRCFERKESLNATTPPRLQTRRPEKIRRQKRRSILFLNCKSG